LIPEKVKVRQTRAAFTDFGVEIWGKTQREIEEDARSNSDAEKEDVVE